RVAVGLVKISATSVWFEGDINGTGVVQSVQYMINGSGTCPLCLQRSQIAKVTGNPLTGQGAPDWGTEVNDLTTTTIGAIRSTLVPANQAAQFLTREYADSHYMDLTDAQTVAGVKTFSNSPAVPTPQNPTDAANKAYVDANGGGGGVNLSSPPPIGNVTPNTGNFTTLTVQTTNGTPSPANYPPSGVTQKRPCRVTSKPAMLEAQDRSFDWGAGSLGWHGQCLERSEATAGGCAGAAGMVATAD
ncbi:MAG: hypothetical protein ABSD56_13675, partial [Bryobacteraceae bacterium]